ncbi:hypothetical protein BDP27DRAFT_1435126 [Rhodocollybia butyracea]|uniref:Uncharacterized protein n=1 Tax=Rhodocollybia butyracea TaxID=206335 RepID=A0A9P5P7J5_9AGAR|nr:hypothetical protein BDP27DRAFT_1435126 [Rhodocollybia butyracea]
MFKGLVFWGLTCGLMNDLTLQHVQHMTYYSQHTEGLGVFENMHRVCDTPKKFTVLYFENMRIGEGSDDHLALVMGDLESGIYAIVNVVAATVLPLIKPDDANSSLIASAYPDRKLSQWKVNRLPNETYTLANVASGRFAAPTNLSRTLCLVVPTVNTSSLSPQFRENATIYKDINDWAPPISLGFASDSQMALVELDNNPENRNNWWTFKPQQPAAPAIPGQVAELPTTTTEKKFVEFKETGVTSARPEAKHTYMETKELQQEIGEELELDEGEELGMELDNGEELGEEDEEPTLDVGNEEEENEDDYYSSITWKFWPAACARDLDNAIVGGKDARGNDIFVARAKYKKYFQDGIYPGSIVRNFIYFSYAGEECQIPTRLNVAEVLWVLNRLSVGYLFAANSALRNWVALNPGGETVDGRPLFISRSRLEGIPGLYVGKVELKKLAHIAFNHREETISNYQVLVYA